MNQQIEQTLEEAVAEVLGFLTGLDITYRPEMDRFRAITRQLNRALRLNALEADWSYYSSTEEVGVAHAGDKDFQIRGDIRPRIINDDAVRLVSEDGAPRVWAYFLPRDALHKYWGRKDLRVAVTRNTISFSRPILQHEDGLRIMIPVMREPRMLVLPDSPRTPQDPNLPPTTVPQHLRDQLIDFDRPDLITARAAFQYAQSDPVMQPRVQALEEQYTDLKYQMIEREDRNTDSPYINDFRLGISGSIHGELVHGPRHPHSDEGY